MWYKQILFCLVLSVSALGHGQNPSDPDSLLAVYKQQPRDTNKVLTINTIVNYYMYRDNAKAAEFAREQLALAESLDFISGISQAHYQLGIVYNNRDMADSAAYHYRRSLSLARKLGKHIPISKALRALAILEFSQGRLKAADSINSIDMEQAVLAGDSLGIGLAYDFSGSVNQNRGYYSLALSHVLKGLEIFERLGDSIRIADAMNHLATLEHNLGNFQKAIDYNSGALAIYEAHGDTYYQAQALNDIGLMHKLMNDEKRALEFFDRSLKKSEEAGVTSLKVAAFTNIGSVHIQMGQPKNAIGFLEQAIELGQSINAQRRMAIARNRLAEALLLDGKPTEALEALNLAQTYALQTGSPSILRTSFENYSAVFETLQQPQKALEYYKKFKTISDSLLNSEKVRTIEGLRVQFDLTKKEADLALQEEAIKTLNAKAQADRLTKGLYAGGMFSFLAISGGLFFGFRQRIKRNRIAREKQEAIYRQEIEHKKKELASQTLHLVQKNTFLEELQENLENLRKSPEKFKMEFRRIAMLLRKEKASDKDWETFKTYFAQVHNDFDQKLKTFSPDISEKEIRLAAFLRMNLTTKEIAATMNVLPESVLKSKYRLKKKLGIKQEIDLNEFLNTL
ncbi:tetratricopeptide repeat protein [Robiginitalea sediminis]|uniref:tetratricopeptide repeat protein n=1 Tax=Robiginitalea sediminis TaxID=1982593 RepID=UPI000B4B4FEC|nr:tetratricopeptide repeat protein [Robiginitalea sediminis]